MAKHDDGNHFNLASLPTIAHSLKIPLPRLTGLWDSRLIFPVKPGADGPMFDRAKVETMLKITGDLSE